MLLVSATAGSATAGRAGLKVAAGSAGKWLSKQTRIQRGFSRHRDYILCCKHGLEETVVDTYTRRSSALEADTVNPGVREHE